MGLIARLVAPLGALEFLVEILTMLSMRGSCLNEIALLVYIGALLYLFLGPPPVADSRRPVHLAEGLLCRQLPNSDSPAEGLLCRRLPISDTAVALG